MMNVESTFVQSDVHSRRKGKIDDACEMFENYDFGNDARFLDGWAKIKGKCTTQDGMENMLAAKLFYFSKQIMPLSKADYLSWKNANQTSINAQDNKKLRLHCGAVVESKPKESSIDVTEYDDVDMAKQLDVDKTECKNPVASLVNNDKVSVTGTVKSCDSSESGHGQPHYPISFLDIMTLVQEGKQIPGIEEIDVQPTNMLPSDSGMVRPRKPWEK